MQLQRLVAFVHHLQENATLNAEATGHQLFRCNAGDWQNVAGAKPTKDQTEILDWTREQRTHWRHTNSTEAYLPLSELDCVVIVEFRSSPKSATMARVQKKLEKALQASNDAFDATHDGLTGLLNSKGIERWLKANLRDEEAETTSDQETAAVAASVAVIEMDIDHFKQVNDSYGHDYGDIVLQCFANRLVKVATQLEAENEKLEVSIGRPGGEEFLILLHGVLSLAGVQEIAEGFRASIAGEPLPTEPEWQYMAKGSVTKLPHVTERRVTASVGASSLVDASKSGQPAIASQLRREADAALYRAKAGGRNAVRMFTEIRDKFGTVLEHHADTDIVAIDLGSPVKVQVGHEFFVYHPDFSGTKDFVFADGRSTKRLGRYPRVACGRVIVFDAQSEISFCHVAEKKINKFPTGSLLEYIPLGSIAHLITHGGTTTSEQLQNYASELVQAKATPLSLVAFLCNSEELEKTKGTAFVNKCLAILFETLGETFSHPSKLAQIERDKIAVVARYQDSYTREFIETALVRASERCGHAATFSAGMFTEFKKLEGHEGDRSVLESKQALTYARYAAFVATKFAKNPTLWFTPKIANDVVAEQRSAGRLDEAFADYKALRELGVKSGTFENAGALTCMLQGQFDIGLECAKRAIELHDDPTFRANMAVILFGLDRRVESYEAFEAITAGFPKYSLPTVYAKIKALSMYAAFKQGETFLENTAVETELRNALEHGGPAGFSGLQTQIQEALRALNTTRP